MAQDHTLRTIFMPETTLATGRGPARIEHRTIGQLAVRSDRLIVCDPLEPLDRAPLALHVAHGEYPVMLVIAVFDSDERVAFACLRLRDTVPERWESAPTLGFDPTAAGILAAPGYAADSGHGCFLDQPAAHALFAAMDGDAADAMSADLRERLRRNQRGGWTWADIVLDARSGSNMIAFSTGMSSGVYSSFCGYDATGELACIATDFQCEDWSRPGRVVRAAAKPAPRRWWKLWG